MSSFLDSITEQLDSYESTNASVFNKVAKKNFKLLPESEDEFISLCDEFITSDSWHLFNITTIWLKLRKSAIDIKFFAFFDKWVNHHIHGWGMTDQFCYRVINPLIEKYKELYPEIIKWSKSENKDVRRISLACFIRSTGSLIVYYDFDKVINVVERLKYDEDFHVQKAVGWVLKCTYKNYPDRLVKYLRKNSDKLKRSTFRYALENMPKDLKEILMGKQHII